MNAAKPKTLWDVEDAVSEHGIDVPRWIDQDIDGATVASIVQGGCASGAYMPAVTYHEATETMAKHGDAVLDYIQDVYGELPQPAKGESWRGLAVFYLSMAVELWADVAADELAEELGLEEL